MHWSDNVAIFLQVAGKSLLSASRTNRDMCNDIWQLLIPYTKVLYRP